MIKNMLVVTGLVSGFAFFSMEGSGGAPPVDAQALWQEIELYSREELMEAAGRELWMEFCELGDGLQKDVEPAPAWFDRIAEFSLKLKRLSVFTGIFQVPFSVMYGNGNPEERTLEGHVLYNRFTCLDKSHHFRYLRLWVRDSMRGHFSDFKESFVQHKARLKHGFGASDFEDVLAEGDYQEAIVDKGIKRADEELAPKPTDISGDSRQQAARELWRRIAALPNLDGLKEAAWSKVRQDMLVFETILDNEEWWNQAQKYYDDLGNKVLLCQNLDLDAPMSASSSSESSEEGEERARMFTFFKHVVSQEIAGGASVLFGRVGQGDTRRKMQIERTDMPHFKPGRWVVGRKKVPLKEVYEGLPPKTPIEQLITEQEQKREAKKKAEDLEKRSRSRTVIGKRLMVLAAVAAAIIGLIARKYVVDRRKKSAESRNNTRNRSSAVSS